MVVWNVYLHNININKIEVFNIFNHSRFREDVKKLKMSKNITKEEFAEELRKILLYYYWCKFEYEIAISGLFDSDKDFAEKIDIYSQVRLNWDAFVNYVWEVKTRDL